jgi:hypothetical protein
MKPVQMLHSLSTLEISNVRRAANRGKYAITKSEKIMSLKAVLSTPAEGEEQFVATLKSAGADATRIEAATAAYRLQKGFADVLQPEDFGVAKAHKEPDGDEREEMDEEDEEDEKKSKKSKKNIAGSKSNDQTATTKSADDARLVAVMKTAEVLSAQVKELSAKNEMLEYVSIAKSEFAHVPGSVEQLAVTLRDAHNAGPAVEKTILAALRSTNEITAKSDHMREIGTNGGGQTGGAYQKIEALASGLTMKSDSGKEMSQAQKIAYVTSNTAEGRELYKQYNEEKRQLIKRM